MSFLTGTAAELIYASPSSGTAKASFTTEVQINDTAGMGVQARIPQDFWQPSPLSAGKCIRIMARGVMSCTNPTPSYTWTVRAGAAGSTSSAILLGTASTVMTASITNWAWELSGDVMVSTVGAAGANTTVQGFGEVNTWAPATLAWVPASSSATNLDTSITNYINFNVACSVSNASNSVTLQQLQVFGLN